MFCASKARPDLQRAGRVGVVVYAVGGQKKNPGSAPGFMRENEQVLFYLIHNGLKGLRVVHRQIGEDFSVQVDVVGLYLTHEF